MGVDCLDRNPVERKDSNMSTESQDQERMRFDSESSNSNDGFDTLEPLDFDDIRRYVDLGKSNSGNLKLKKSMEVKKPRRKRLDSLDSIDENGDPKVTLFSVAMCLRRKEKGKPMPLAMRPQTRATKNWLKALHLTRERSDPWEKFHLDELPVENGIRHRYNALSQKWSTEQVVVKMDKESFACGAMRECYRMKKLSNFSQNQDWSRDSNNYVAKAYMDHSVDRKTYFEDVKLQMDAKLWGEEYNRHNPPKKVDIFMMAVLELVDRPGKPLFHVEHYIDGEYVKYNSNSGFVDNRLARQTPHAFSHFTFERSGHELIVVDVQGVGDLYTDPQIHTAEGDAYGDGNLGVRGMALFFHSHQCNAICRSLGLEKFDLASTERDAIHSNRASTGRSVSQTVLRGSEVAVETPSDGDKEDNFQNFFRTRSMSNDWRMASRSISKNSCGSDCQMEEVFSADEHSDEEYTIPVPRRQRLQTELSEVTENDIKTFQDRLQAKARPSNLMAEIQRQNVHDDSILGQVHLALARYHECCRFAEDGKYDKEAALFHLRAAAECGIVSAIVAIARMHCGLPHDILADVNIEDESITEEERMSRGLAYMQKAAEASDRAAMVFLAQSYDYGANGAKKDLDMAMYWYETIVAYDEEEGGDTEEIGLGDPPYIMMARLAEIWLSGDLKGGKNPQKAGDLYSQAAESATTCMKGKLANKYYMLAEEAWGEIEE